MQYNVTAEIVEALAAGATTAQFEKLGAENLTRDWHKDQTPEWVVWNRRELDAVLALHAKVTARAAAAAPEATDNPAAATPAAPAPAAGPKATAKQVALIEKLLRENRDDEGGFMAGPRDRAGIAALTRRQASTYIDSLLGRY